jgi:hypothetical protein
LITGGEELCGNRMGDEIEGIMSIRGRDKSGCISKYFNRCFIEH